MTTIIQLKNATLELSAGYVKQDLPAKKWLADLRSGEYKQAPRKLHDESGYCCLGVLSKGQGRLQLIDDRFCDGLYGPSTTLADDNPLFSILGSIGAGRQQDLWSVINNQLAVNSLTQLNDANMPFDEIAEVIEHLYNVV